MSEEKPIPAKMLDAAAKAVVRYEANLHSCSLRLTEEFYGEMIEVALRAAGVPELASAREAIGAALFRHGYDTGWTTQEAIECIDAMAARIAELEATNIKLRAEIEMLETENAALEDELSEYWQ